MMRNRERLRQAMDRRLAALDYEPAHRLAVYRRTQQQAPRRPRLRLTALVLGVLVLSLTAMAALLSPTLNLFGWLYGKNAPVNQFSFRIPPEQRVYELNGLRYELDEVHFVHWSDAGNSRILGSVWISAAPEAGVILLPEEYGVDYPAGYNPHLGTAEEAPDGLMAGKPPEGSPSYADLARAKGLRMLQARAVPRELHIDGRPTGGDHGYLPLVSLDGRLRYSFEMDVLPRPRNPEQAAYSFTLFLRSYELTEDGNIVQGTDTRTEWAITLGPQR